MRRALIAILTGALLAWSVAARAAQVGSFTESAQTYRTIRAVSFVWTSSAGGAVSGQASGTNFDGMLVGAIFIPGTGGVQPSNLYGVTIVDQYGFDVLQGKGANKSNTTASELVPLIGDGTTTDQLVPLAGTLTLTVSAAGNAKQGTVILLYR